MGHTRYIIISQENYTLEKALEPYDKKTRDLVMRENERKRVIPAQGYLEYDKVIFVAVMPDDSGSIFGENKLSIDNSNDVIEGHNDVVKALKGSQSADYMQFKTQYLNGRVLNNWFPLDEVTEMNRSNFTSGGYTPLYDNTINLLAGVIFETGRALKRGQEARWGIMVTTDGADIGSMSKASDVKIILDNLREKGELLEDCQPDNDTAGSIAFMGISDGVTPFEETAKNMGIHWIISEDRRDHTKLRRAFNFFSRSLNRLR